MKLALAALMLLSVMGSVLAQVPAQVAPQRKSAGFDPKRDGAKDIAAAVKVATKQNKRILLDVGGEW